jgi:hypothetical protein
MKPRISPYKEQISQLWKINRNNQWEVKRGRLKGQTITNLIKEYSRDEVEGFLETILDNEEALYIDKIITKDILKEIKTRKYE